MNRFTKIWKGLGPGLMYAAAAIGVSHLVQSSRAGGLYGFELVWVVLLIHLVKYPFFLIGPLFAAHTNKSLIQAYAQMGKGYLGFYIVLTLTTVFTIQAAVTLVTAAILASWLPFDWSPAFIGVALLFAGALFLWKGRYYLLDKLVKWVVLSLTLATLAALGLAFFQLPAWPEVSEGNAFQWERRDWIFLIALMGWMPAPLDIAVWQSVWTLEKKRLLPKFDLKAVKRDYEIGFWGTCFLALVFLSLGALVLFPKGMTLDMSSTAFISVFIQIYTETLGGYAYHFMMLAAVLTMLSTSLTTLDAGPRILGEALALWGNKGKTAATKIYRMGVWVLASGTAIILLFFTASLTQMVDLATILSFITTPFLAFLSWKAINSQYLSPELKPGKWFQIWAISGIVLLLAFALGFLYIRFMV